MAAIQVAKISLFVFQLKQTFPQNGSSVGFLVTLVSIVSLIFGLSVGSAIARFNAKPVLLLGLLSGAALSIFEAYATSFWTLAGLRALEGFSHLAVVVSAPTLISEIADNRLRPAAMTLWGTFFGAAFTLFALVGPKLYSFGGISTVFLAHGMALIIVALCVSKFVSEGAKTCTRKEQEENWAKNFWPNTLQAYRNVNILAPAIAWLFYTFLFVASLTVFPIILTERDSTIAIAVMPMSSIAVNLIFANILLQTMTALRVASIGFLGACIFAFLLLIVNPSWQLCALITASLGLVQGATFAAVPELNKRVEDQALSNGALAQLGALGNLVGTPLFLFALASFDTLGLGLLTGLAALIATITCFSLRVRNSTFQ